MSLATTNVRNEGIGLSRLIAINLAREGIELTRNIRDSNWLSDRPWYAGLVDDAGDRCAVIQSVRQGSLNFLACPAAPTFFDNAFGLSLSSQNYAVSDTRELPFDEYVQDGMMRSATEQPTVFYRTIILDPFCLNSDKTAETIEGCVVNDDCLDESKRESEPTCANQAIGVRVTAEVSWKQSGSEYTTRIREHIYNWR
jgi:hypothetical protein